MEKVKKLTKSDIKRLIESFVGESLEQKMTEIDEYITDRGKQPAGSDYVLITRIVKAAYDKKFEPTYLMEYLMKKLKEDKSLDRVLR